jgi:hypothetical protein
MLSVRARVQGKDMKVDGSLCSLPRSSAFVLGVAAIAFLFVAQLVGTTAAVTAKPKKSSAARGRVALVGLLVLSWYVNMTTHGNIVRSQCDQGANRIADESEVRGRTDMRRASFAVTVILLATAASMNHGQRSGRGWMDGDCYVARNGVIGAAAALVVVTVLITLGSPSPPSPRPPHRSTCRPRQQHAPAAIHLDTEQPGERS